jgi:hypothetical protein
MSKGPGRIERAIGGILDAEPEGAFSAEQLCRRVYELDPYERGAVWKQHRVASIRAGKRLAKRRPEIAWRRSEGRPSEIIFFRHDNAISYQMGQLKSGAHPFLWGRKTDEEFRRMIKDGHPCRPVERFIAKRDGDTDKVAQLDTEAAQELKILEMALRKA